MFVCFLRIPCITKNFPVRGSFAASHRFYEVLFSLSFVSSYFSISSLISSLCMLNCVQPFITPWTVAHYALLSMNFPDKNTGMGCHSSLTHWFSSSILFCFQAMFWDFSLISFFLFLFSLWLISSFRTLSSENMLKINSIHLNYLRFILCPSI